MKIGAEVKCQQDIIDNLEESLKDLYEKQDQIRIDISRVNAQLTTAKRMMDFNPKIEEKQ